MSSSRVLRLHRVAEDSVDARDLRRGIAAIQAEQKIETAFPEEVERAAAAAAKSPRLPDLDRTDLALVTIDPPGSMDLDQALHISRDGRGYTVSYAIADLAAFITPGDALDLEAQRRGQTLYGADSKVPLHPKSLSEGAASLLPDQVRPALLWTIGINHAGERTSVHVERARVRSRAKLDYAGVQKSVDDGTASESLKLLKEVGELRMRREAVRGGVSLPIPDQEIDIDGPDWRLEFRSMLPAERWNEQISLLCGFGAASLMVYARVGLLRTLPPPDPRDIKRLHRTARALHIDWPAEQVYPDFIRSLDPSKPAHAAMVVALTRLLRGSGYVAFNGEVPEQPEHAGLASEYSHVTAPLRRLVDRYTGEVCLALCAGDTVPGWVLTMLPELPDIMRDSTRRANNYERAIVDLVETGVLRRRVGEVFDAVVVDVEDRDDKRGDVTIAEPAVEAAVRSDRPLPLGTDVRVKLVSADLKTRKVEFVVA